MSAGSIAGLVLGSSVIGALLGGWLKSVTEREASFRERLIVASVDFLGTVAQTRNTLGGARRALGGQGVQQVETGTRAGKDAETRAFDELHEAVAALWNTIPLLLVIFPTPAVADAARALTEELAGAEVALVNAWHANLPVEFGQRFRRIDRLHMAYAEIARRDIRRGAYGSRRLLLRGSRRRSPRPIPRLPHRLLGPRVLRSTRWDRWT